MSLLLGIDIGGTSVKLGLVTRAGEIVRQNHFSTQSQKSADAFFRRLTLAIQELLQAQGIGTELIGVGVGAPGHIQDTGIIIDAVNLPFKANLPIGPYLEDLLNIPSFVIKDSKAAAYGEKRWGAGQSASSFVLLMLGTGLGYATYSNGTIINGYKGLAGEFGHVTFILNGRECNCGKKGCLETYVSATGLKRTAFELLASMTAPSPLRDYTFNSLETSMIAELANAGDPIAKKAFDLTGYYLGTQLANLTEQLTPEVFIIAGGLAKSGDLILKPTRQTLEAGVQPVYRNRVDIRLSELGSSEVGLLGAAALALENIILQP